MTKRNLSDSIRADYVTFGCKLNFAETESVASQLEKEGVVRVSGDEKPDIIIVNTCSVTSVADRKCRQAIRSLHRKWPEAAIFVTGCYAQLKPDEVRMLPGVVAIAGNNAKNSIPFLVEEWLNCSSTTGLIENADRFTNFEPSCSRGNRTRYFLKIQDGCNYFCSYCTIPLARGRSRSPEISEVIDAAKEVADQGGKEIVLTGVNIGDFGRGRTDNFFQLIQALDAVEGIERYRISSIEPNLLTDEIIGFVASSNRFMPHFHVPLQCGDDDVLRLMHRHYDTELFARRITAIREKIPDAYIGVDVIVGMRGETEQRFINSKNFIESLPLTKLHVFPYSEREGTQALKIEYVVDNEEKKRRLDTLMRMSMQKETEFYRTFKGSMRKVLFETSANGRLTGHTDNYIRVELDNEDAGLINNIAEVRIGGTVVERQGLKAIVYMP